MRRSPDASAPGPDHVTTEEEMEESCPSTPGRSPDPTFRLAKSHAAPASGPIA